jgi:hypothetical protein
MRTKELSLKSYKLAITAIVILAVVYSISSFFMLLQTELPSRVSISDGSREIRALLSAIFNSTNLLSLITFIFLKKNKNIFVNESLGLNKSQKIILFILGVIIFFPSLSVSFSFIKESFYPDIKQLEMQGEVDHKLYMPQYLPANIGIASQYHIGENNSLNLSSPTVRIAFDTPITEMVVGDKSKMVILNQSLAPYNFDLFDYVKKQRPDSNPQKIELETAIKRTAYLISPDPKIEGGSIVTSLYFVTTENILLEFASISQEISTEDLIKIAESVE